MAICNTRSANYFARQLGGAGGVETSPVWRPCEAGRVGASSNLRPITELADSAHRVGCRL